MERLRRIAAFWSWLPAFRAVAETQHLPTASEQLLVTAPALSRSIHQLERELGQELFLRSGRRLVLNDAGERFLAAVRDAMRLVHEGMLAIRDEQLSGALHIASAGLATSFLVDALHELLDQHRDLVPHVSAAAPDRVAGQLLRGEIDAAFLSLPLRHPGLCTEHLGRATSGVYCGRDHPLHGVATASLEQLVAHPFVAPGPLPDGQTHEGWPADIPRNIAMFADRMQLGAEICSHGRLLAVLPDGVARQWGDRLFRLPIDLVTPTELFAMTRPELMQGTRAKAIVDAVRKRIVGAAGVAGGSPSHPS